MLYLPSLMMELDPWQHDEWRQFMSYVFGMVNMGVLPDGTAYSAGARDATTGEVKPIDPGWGGGPTRTGRIAAFGWGYVNAQRWLPDEDFVSVARTILEQQDVDTFRFVMPAVPSESMPEDWRCESELLDQTCITSWLWMYWEGRFRGYW